MRYVDPTGEIITIIYTENGVKHSFCYSGTETNIPRNTYVQLVIEAYQYNKQNWKRAEFEGNSPTTDLVERGNINVYLFEDTNGPSTYLMGNGGIPFIRWNPYEGLSCGQGVVLSPASILAHEADHAIDELTDSKAHSDRRDTLDPWFDNAEERRVITGSEQKTATANGEIRKGQVTRRNHEGKTVYTNGVTSSEIDQMTTDYYRKHYEKSY